LLYTGAVEPHGLLSIASATSSGHPCISKLAILARVGTLLGKRALAILSAHARDVRETLICPQCRSSHCFRSRRHGFFDLLGTLARLRPWRCRACDRRFYAWSVAVGFSGYAHCPKCGNFDLGHIARDRVLRGTLVFLKRIVGFPAYRCDPCRENFFSVLPFRRIVPSMVAAERRAAAS
jgi:hypothetical protein